MVDQAEGLRQMMREMGEETNAARAEKKQRIITVASGKGGVGKTNVAVNLALKFQEKGKNTLLMDGDLGLSNVNVLLGEIPRFNLFHVYKGVKTLPEIITPTRWGIDIIAGASGYRQLANLAGAERERFLLQFNGMEKYEIIIIDAGAGISDTVLDFVLYADEVLIVTTPEPTSITDAYGIIKAIAAEKKDRPVKLIINRCRDMAEGRKTAIHILDICRRFLSLEVENLGLVYDDPAVRESVSRQKPFTCLYPKHKVSVCLDHLAQRLLQLEPDKLPAGGIRQFFLNIFARQGS
ncbi:MAG: hypothetical protein A2096_04215 [Spirochaetes bacterium GWF1_41_5]|nr:MAG: hypothetical protein A2096_04215 [Spirochaetes bacterium GWF1_41_5]HBE03041.1 ATP-binding protein [Spirochaetia bacterium]